MSDKGSIFDRMTNVNTRAGQLTRISTSRLGAEMTNIACGFGGLILAQSLLKQPLEPVRDFVAQYIVKPNLSLFEKTGDYLPSLQTPDETKEMEAMTPDARARSYANAIVNMSVGIVGGLGGQIAGQMLFDRLTAVPNIGANRHVKVALIDRTVQLGVILGLNTIFAKPSIDAQKGLENILHKQLGLAKEEAHSSADYLINWQVPNVGGALAAIVAHFHYSKGMKW